jgi:hypothetical protein
MFTRNAHVNGNVRGSRNVDVYRLISGSALVVGRRALLVIDSDWLPLDLRMNPSRGKLAIM